MEVIVRNTICPRHPDTHICVVDRMREAVLNGLVNRITILSEAKETGICECTSWPEMVKQTSPADEEERSRTLAEALRCGVGNVLIFDCSCTIRPEVLHTFANLTTATVLVGDPVEGGKSAKAAAQQEGRTSLQLDGLGTAIAGSYLGAILLTGEERPDLCATLEESDFLLSWPGAIGLLSRRIRLRGAVLSRDIHGNETVVENKLAGGSYARTYLRLHAASGRRTVRKEAMGVGRGKLTEEIHWLRGLEGPASRHFPEVVEHRIEPYGVSMDLTYHHLPTLRRLILSGQIDEAEAARWACRVLAVLKQDIHPVGQRPAPGDYVWRTHLRRIEERLAETASALPERQALWSADKVRVNGVWLRNVHELVTALAHNQHALRILTPKHLVRTHGDPHFDNILIDRNSYRFYLIDPRGNDGYDVAYDLGKIWHSVNSMYDLIHDGHVRVEAQGDEINYTLTSPRMVAFYRRVRERIRSWLTATGWSQGDPYWLLKVRLAEAAHMCSVMPFHIARDQQDTVALACYARGLELINSLYADLTSAPAPLDPWTDRKDAAECV
ncbi:phosphotransferase [Cystobacter fuscus]|nr:phosphotransferase [Cystobacter fuscus]